MYFLKIKPLSKNYPVKVLTTYNLLFVRSISKLSYLTKPIPNKILEFLGSGLFTILKVQVYFLSGIWYIFIFK